MARCKSEARPHAGDVVMVDSLSLVIGIEKLSTPMTALRKNRAACVGVLFLKVGYIKRITLY
jgi:hypothetical protein